MATIIEQLGHNALELYVDYYPTTIEDPPAAGSVIQTFTLSAAYDVAAVSLMVGYWTDGAFPAHRTLRVSLYAANAVTGETTGSALGSATKATSAYSWNPPSYQMMVFTFATAVVLAAGEYAIVVDVPAGNQLWGDFELTEVLPETFWWLQMATWGPRGHVDEQYASGMAFVLQGTVVVPSTGVEDWAFSIDGAESASPPDQASNPSPANAATSVGKAALTLSWDTGSDETGQNVYFGQTGSMVLVSSNQAGHTYAVASSSLAYNTEYSWRVDTINADGTTTGNVWTFTVAAFSPPADLVVLRFLVAAANGKLFYES